MLFKQGRKVEHTEAVAKVIVTRVGVTARVDGAGEATIVERPVSYSARSRTLSGVEEVNPEEEELTRRGGR